MSPALLAVIGMPGGIELLVILFILALLFGIPLTILLLLGYRLTGKAAESEISEERIDELEAEVEALQQQLEDDK